MAPDENKQRPDAGHWIEPIVHERSSSGASSAHSGHARSNDHKEHSHHHHGRGPKFLHLKPNGSSSHTEHEYSFEELEKVERRRRAVHRRVERSFYDILKHKDGTVLSFLLKDHLFWATFLLYVILRAICRYGRVPGFVSELGSENSVGIIGGFISFFLVLYVNKSHERYFSLYNTSMAIKARILELATLTKAYMNPIDAARGFRFVRYLNAAHIAGYVGLDKTYPAGTFFAKLNRDFALLTDDEYERMKTIGLDEGGATCSRELLLWCTKIFRTFPEEEIDAANGNIFRGNLMAIQSGIEKLFDDEDLPIPFFHVHFICLLAVLYLPLFAISTAIHAGTGRDVFWTADIVGGLIVVLQAIFIIGLRRLGQKMSNPYGDDLIDLSVLHFVTYTWTMTTRIMECEDEGMEIANAHEEQALRAKHVSVGGPWENGRHHDMV